ncbi:hypothetical protein [Thermococcus sp.]|uniref:hypothetical protein n=1 Tax=Thermococcus sp. TaxID=35749 RepID=UPI00260C07AE|nr:hypothetical protein [Thermococcus sp.]
MRPKPVVVSFFSLLATFFYGLGLLGGSSGLLGYGFIGSIHLLLAVGIWKENETAVDLSSYLTLLDMLFGLLWVMVGLSIPAITLTLLSALILVVLADEDVRTELKEGHA